MTQQNNQRNARSLLNFLLICHEIFNSFNENCQEMFALAKLHHEIVHH